MKQWHYDSVRIIGTPRNYRDRGTDKIDICAIAAELRDAVNKLRLTNGSH